MVGLGQEEGWACAPFYGTIGKVSTLTPVLSFRHPFFLRCPSSVFLGRETRSVPRNPLLT